MVVPPPDFRTSQANTLYSTNYPPNSPYVHSNGGAGSGGGPFLTSRGYYRPAPGTTVELVNGGSSTYRAGSSAEAEETVARGGFGEGGEGGEGHGGEGHGGGGE